MQVLPLIFLLYPTYFFKVKDFIILCNNLAYEFPLCYFSGSTQHLVLAPSAGLLLRFREFVELRHLG